MKTLYTYRNLLLLKCCSIFFLYSISNKTFAQEKSSLTIWNKIISIENDEQLSVAEKLFSCEKLKESFDNNHLPADSVYARLLHRIAALQFQLNQMIATQEVIDNTMRAIQINNSGNKNSSPYYAINSYVNLATYYETLKFYKKAYTYYDSAIINNDNKKLSNPMGDLCYINKVLIDFRLGDYQKCIEDCTKGIFIAEKSLRLNMLAALYNQRAQSYLYLHKTNLVYPDIDSARKYATILKNNYELATEAKTRALLKAELQQYNNAVISFSKSLKYRIADGDLAQIADDYTDIGNFYLKRKEYNKAIENYNKTILYAENANDAERMCKGYTNLGEVFFQKGSATDYEMSEKFYARALEIFGIHEKSVFENPSLQKLGAITNTDLLLALLGNKTELLLNLYNSNSKKEYLNACINTGLLMDSAITLARHEQTGENSKLYWRNKTRTFFSDILEACYLANDIPHAFYFMEKSRAVLLNDKLNEAAASIRLPEEENLKEQQFKFRLVEAKMQMNNTDIRNTDYSRRQLKFLQVKDEFERYIKTLEQKYPEYYKYKYDDDIPALHTLQEKLAKNDETFIHYFIEDTVLYTLTITAAGAKLTKPAPQQFHEADLKSLMNMCSD
ncbi:MAG: tetratricopeptide repeat protein, partial [Chitinophagaceae bacterium]|nr:tetratricopeptide repeat protein [Chitinophagaceae bacterium]